MYTKFHNKNDANIALESSGMLVGDLWGVNKD